MQLPTPEAIAKQLAELFDEEFGGQDRGRYWILHHDLRRLAGRAKLEESVIRNVSNHLLDEHQLALVNCGRFYGVMGALTVPGWRQYLP